MDEAALAITAIARGVSPLGRDAFSFFSAENNNNENHAQQCTSAAVLKYHRHGLHFFSFQQQLLNYSSLNYYAAMLLLVYTVSISVLPHHQPLGHLLSKGGCRINNMHIEFSAS